MSARLEEVLRHLPVAGAAMDRGQRYLAFNEAWLRIHGVDPDHAIIGRSHDEAFPGQGGAWRAVCERCMAGAVERIEEEAFVDQRGTLHQVRWVVAPWRDPDKTIRGVLVYVEDLTNELTAVRRLEERESLIRDLFEHSTVGLNLCTMSGLWLESNPAFLDIIGYSREEADGGLTYWELTPRSYDEQEALQLDSLRARKRYGPYEKEFIRKDGRLVPVRLNGFLVERDGEQFIWSLIEDLTAQRELERRLEVERTMAVQASKLATLGEMAAGIAHEVNNPLTIVSGYAYVLRGAIERSDKAAIESALAAIDGAVERAAHIIKGLRRFSRQSAGEPHEMLDVATLVDEAIELCRARARTLGVSIEVEVRAATHTRGHAVELSQVLVNLIHNALHAAAAAATHWVRVTVAEREAMVELSVVDSGAPIDAAIVPKIFQAFFTTKDVGEGTGLGLSISRTIIEAHGGTLTYEPTDDHTQFVLRLRSDA